jgi:hypothetical protein
MAVTAREGTVLKTRELVIGAATAAILFSFAAGPSRAEMWDLLRPKKLPTTTALGQSPDRPSNGKIIPVAYSESEYSDSILPSGWGYDSSPCFNCGECDHHIRCTQRHRRCCGQTWYPRMAPYCQSGWGWTQPCWRRMADNYHCP